ncbi:MAG: hypothetical protein IJ751_08940 [Oscillospiraceae bacterium]|nr:hypothetical protein [Oscillospiraceae bacterium]
MPNRRFGRPLWPMPEELEAAQEPLLPEDLLPRGRRTGPERGQERPEERIPVDDPGTK